MRRGVNTREAARKRAFLAGSLLVLVGCGGPAVTLPPSTPADAIPGTPGGSAYDREAELLRSAPVVRCEPSLFADGDIELARAVDAWLERDELGYGSELETLAPTEAFRVGLESFRLDRRRTLSGTRARLRLEGSEEATVHAYLEDGVIPDAPGLGRLAYVVDSSEQALVGSFCRTSYGYRTSCRYATLGGDTDATGFGPALAPLADVVVVPMTRGGRPVKAVVGHVLVDEDVLPKLVVDFVDVASRAVERVESSFESRTVFLGARVEGETLTLLGVDDRTWLAAAASGPAHETAEPTIVANRRCAEGARIVATTRVRIPLSLAIGGVSLHSDAVVPPFELVYSDDAEGRCDVRLELANREGGNGSIDGSVGGVLTPSPDADDAMDGTLTTWFGPMEASCAIER